MIQVDVALRLGHFCLEAAFANDDGITALFGSSGSGKSTLINLIAGLARPDRGRIELDGRVLVDRSSGAFVPRHRRRVGLVFQDAQLFPHLSVRHNLLFGRWFAPRNGHGAGATPVKLETVVDTLGIGGLLDRRPDRLSGGEKQRVAIGRALLAHPRILLMDEPLASLDVPRKREIMALIEQIRDDFRIPIVYVSHSVEEVARLASTVVVLDDGRVAAVGPPTAVLATALDRQGGTDRFAIASVLELSASAYNPRYGVTPLYHPAGTVTVTGRIEPPGRRLRLVVRATDVALATERLQALSMRNALTGTVTAITADGGPLATVHLALDGGDELLASVTRLAIDGLGLAVGAPVFAMIKTVAIDEGAMGALEGL